MINLFLDDYDEYFGFGDGYSEAFTGESSAFGGDNGGDLVVIQSAFGIVCSLPSENTFHISDGGGSGGTVETASRFKIND